MSSIEMAEEFLNPSNIKVVGIGGAGCNTINRMIEGKFFGAEFIALNTDVQSLGANQAGHKIQIGAQITKGLGAGANPEIGEKAAFESKEAIQEALKGANMVFITAGMGGGTGTGAAPVVAAIAKEMGVLTIAIVTKPFQFEGKKRMAQAVEGLERFEGNVDSIIAISNQKLLDSLEDNTLSLIAAFEKVDEVLIRAVQGIADIINKTGIVNVDFADVRVIMNNAGTSIMGFGVSSGKDRALQAAQMALVNPLLDIDIKGAKGILVNISGGKGLSLLEYNQVVEFITQKAHEDATIIAGAFIEESYEERIEVTVIATSFQIIPKTESIKTPLPLYKEESPVQVEEEQPSYVSKLEDKLEESEPLTAKNFFSDSIANNKDKGFKLDLETKEEPISTPKEPLAPSFLSKKEVYKMVDEDFLSLSKLEVPTYQRKNSL